MYVCMYVISCLNTATTPSNEGVDSVSKESLPLVSVIVPSVVGGLALIGMTIICILFMAYR